MTDRTLNKEKLNREAVEHLILSRNPDKAIQEMMEVIDSLRAVYVEENDALFKADTSKFLALQEEKLRTARDYKAGAEQLLGRKGEFANINPALRRKLAKRHEEFSELTATNLDALNLMRKSVQRLGDRIMHVARDAIQKDAPNYSASGSLGNSDRRVSIGLNESA